ncbi:MAG: sulfite dehydrogenase [Gemmatimonadales bacterium]
MAKKKDQTSLSRRALLAGAAGALGSTVLGNTEKASGQSPAAADPTKVLGDPPTSVGERSAHVHLQRTVSRSYPSASSGSPLQDLDGIITPSDLHFERHHGGVPTIDPANYALLIHGMVDRPMMFSLDDLRRFPAESRTYFVECSGNGFRGFRASSFREDLTPQQIDGLTSTSEWTGVPVRTLFNEVGVRPDATWFLAEGMDAAVLTRSIPVEKALDDALIVYAQNGEPLRPENGFPARLLLPGWEGNACVKWIRRLELADAPFMSRQETSKYSDPLADCTARIFSFEMDAKSIITFPAYPDTLHERGYWEISGIAWTGRGKIARVEISTDGGSTWNDAELQDPVLPKCHTRFRYLWQWNGSNALLMSRAHDETGYVQPTLEQLIDARGAGTSYHANNIRAWRVKSDGSVVFGLEP